MSEQASPRHGLPFAVNLSILYTDLPVLERPAAARDAGFGAVEFWWPFEQAVPGDRAVDAFVRAITDAGVTLSGLNFAAGDMPGGDRGLVSWVGREREFADNVEVAAGIADRLQVPALNALYGNRIDGEDPVKQDELALTNLALAASATARVGASVLVEPLSGAPKYPLTTVADGLGVLDKLGRDNVLLLADLYHLATNGADIDALIAGHTARIGHVQIADVPGRNEPGTGELDIDGYLSALEAAGYAGYVGLEYKPSTTSAESFNWLPRARRKQP